MKGLICLIRGHKHVVTQELTDWSRRTCCSRCRRMFVVRDDWTEGSTWDADWHRMYESHGIKIVYVEGEGQ